MIGWLVDQSRHRAARVVERHQKWTAEVAAMTFRFAIDRADTGVGGPASRRSKSCQLSWRSRIPGGMAPAPSGC